MKRTYIVPDESIATGDHEVPQVEPRVASHACTEGRVDLEGAVVLVAIVLVGHACEFVVDDFLAQQLNGVPAVQHQQLAEFFAVHRLLFGHVTLAELDLVKKVGVRRI